MAHSRRRPSADTTTLRDYYQEVTDRVIAALEEGTMPWRKPWNPDLCGIAAIPRNASTNRRYSGINVLLLAMSIFAWGTEDNRWCSYKQAEAKGWQVRKGSKATTIFFFKKLDVATGERSGEAQETRQVALMRAYGVFHASQIDGIPDDARGEAPKTTWRRPEAVDVMLRNSGAEVRIGGPAAFYSPLSDHIQLPPHEAFDGPHQWAATALHEMGHWSGAECRLNRDLSGRFGTASYAAEELRAELASVYMGATLGLPCDIPGHASYMRSWLKNLREDKREIFRAAAAAQRIADYCLAFHPEHRPDAEAEGSADAEIATPLAA